MLGKEFRRIISCVVALAFLVTLSPLLACACFLGGCKCDSALENEKGAGEKKLPPCHGEPENIEQGSEHNMPCDHGDCCCGEMSQAADQSAHYALLIGSSLNDQIAKAVYVEVFHTSHLAYFRDSLIRGSPPWILYSISLKTNSRLSLLQSWLV